MSILDLLNMPEFTQPQMASYRTPGINPQAPTPVFQPQYGQQAQQPSFDPITWNQQAGQLPQQLGQRPILQGQPSTHSRQIQEMSGAKEPHQQGITEQILQMRLKPEADDYSRAAQSTFFAGGKPAYAQDFADERLKTTMDRLAEIQKMQYGGTTPSNVQEYEYYKGLPEAEQSNYLNVKRASQLMNLGDRYAVRAPSGGLSEVYEKGLPPQELPAVKGAQQQAVSDVQLGNAAAIESEKKRGAGEITDIAKQDLGRSQVSQTVQDVKDYYSELKAKGAAISTTQSGPQNIINRMRSSAIGQYGGQLLGTEQQSIRNKINQQIPALISAIRQSTGMSARAMDSNIELQFYLQQASNPKLDIEANFAALDALEQKYGLSAIKQQSPQGMPINIDPIDAELKRRGIQ